MPLIPFVRVRTQIEGLHYWPDARPPDTYLATAHRHLFVVDLEVSVRHDDRDIEINALTRWLSSLLPTLAVEPRQPRVPLNFGTQSCEQLAARIVTAVRDRHGSSRYVECTVWEDGILGGGARWHPTPSPPP